MRDKFNKMELIYEKCFNKILLNKVDNHKQENELCRIWGNERVYIEYHRLYNPCKLCFTKNSARYYQINRHKIITRPKL